MDRECQCTGHTLTENTASAVSRCNSGPYLPLYIATADFVLKSPCDSGDGLGTY